LIFNFQSMRLLVLFIGMFFILGLGSTLSQDMKQDTTVLLQDVNVQDSRLANYATGDKIESIRKNSIENLAYGSLSELLSKYSGINIRSYGLGGLSTASIRGTGSNHSSVLWEGLNLQSPMNGSLDLNLTPISFIDQASIQYGAASSLYGTGTMGGAIHIGSSLPVFENKGFSSALYHTSGSFNSQYTGINIKTSSIHNAFTIRVFHKKAQNDFSFFNRFTQEEEIQENAQVLQKGTLLEGAFNLKNHQVLKLKYWYQDSKTNIPKTASEGVSPQAVQTDVYHRTMINWSMKKKNIKLNIKSALLTHKLNFSDTLSIESLSNTNVWINELLSDFKISKNWNIEFGISNTYEASNTLNFGQNNPSRNRTAIFGSLRKLIWNKVETSISIRESLNDQELSPLTPSLGINYYLSSALSLKSKIARSFRLPTFNDLYWIGAGGIGNFNLNPETGVSLEFGIFQESKKEQIISSTNELTFFYNHINNFIQWIPISSENWSPENLDEIWSYGIEYHNTIHYELVGKSKLILNMNYNLNKSTTEKPNAVKNLIDNNQLTYTPVHQIKWGLNFEKEKYRFGVNHNFTSRQYTDEENNELRAVKAYDIFDLLLNYKLQLAKEHSLNLTARVNNLFDKQYEVRSAYPMPGRNFNISIKYNFK
jgi:vitamin B12 transporter